jgi:hypothetical protein
MKCPSLVQPKSDIIRLLQFSQGNVVQPNRQNSSSVILHSLKRHTAREANRLLNRTGSFWEHESYDHYVRDRAEWERIVNYVINNPVKAGLVADWSKWPYSYHRERKEEYPVSA